MSENCSSGMENECGCKACSGDKGGSREVKFDVLLDKTEDNEELKGAPFIRGGPYCRNSVFAVADSIQAVQGAGLLQVPTYAFINGRGRASLDDFVWDRWFHDSLGERLTLSVCADYKDVPKGEYVVDIQGGGLYMPFHELIRSRIREIVKLCSGGHSEKENRSIPIMPEDKDLLLGERQVCRFDGEKIQTVPITHFFTSYSQFEDASESSEFQKSLRDWSAVYVVLRNREEARNIYGGSLCLPVGEHLDNPDLIIPAGGKSNLHRMLMLVPETPKIEDPKIIEDLEMAFKGPHFISRNDGYQCINTGRFSRVGHNGFFPNVNFGDDICQGGGYGNSVGVEPNALEQWRRKLHIYQKAKHSYLECRV